MRDKSKPSSKFPEAFVNSYALRWNIYFPELLLKELDDAAELPQAVLLTERISSSKWRQVEI